MLNPERSLNRRLSDRIATNAVLRALGAAWQPLVLRVRDAGGAPLKNVLDGTFLGHPLHPPLTDVPVGAWTVTAMLDAIEVLGGPDVAFASDASLTLGLLGATAAIATGYADWADTKDEPRTLGMAHAMLNGVAFLSYAAALVLRRTQRRGPGIALAMAGYGLSSFSAYLGGELAFNYQLGVKHTGAPLAPPDEFVDVMAAADLPAQQLQEADAGGIPVLLLRTGDDVHAISAICTHRGGPLGKGTLEHGDCVRCPWHGSVFALEDGRVIEGPAAFPQARFEAETSGERVRLRALQT